MRTEGHALDHLTASTSYATWTTVIPPFTGNYKYLFACTQYIKGTGDEETVTCTTISRDTETESSLQAIYNASAAQTTANTAVTNAATAQSTADTAKNAKRIIQAENLYYMAQKTSKISPTAPDIDSNSTVFKEQLSCEGWSTVYPNTAAYDKEGVVSCDDGATAVVYTCQRLTVTQNGTQSYEFTEVTQDHTAERLYAATKGKTVIEGGYIKTDLLEIDKLFAKQIKLQNTTVNGTTVYGSIYGGERYNADGTDNNTTAKGFYLGADGTLRAKDGYFEGEINATSGTFNGTINATGGTFSGLITQGCKFYVCSRVTIQWIKDKNKMEVKFSNPELNDKVRLIWIDPGKILIEIPEKYMNIGLPKVITHYCSDKYSENTSDYPDSSIDSLFEGTYRYKNTDPRYQINCTSGSNFLIYTGEGFISYLSLFFTDNNNDEYINPRYAVLTLMMVQ